MDGAPSSNVGPAPSGHREGEDEGDSDGGGKYSATATASATNSTATRTNTENSSATDAAADGVAPEDDAPTRSFAAAAASAAAASSSSNVRGRHSQGGGRESGYVYRDYSRISPEDEEGSSESASVTGSTAGGSSSSSTAARPSPPPAAAAPRIVASVRIQKLPAKLYDILAQPSLQHIVSWLPHGRAWKVHLPRSFVEDVMPRYFEYPNYNSFIRLVNAWGFRRLNAGFDRGAYFHELFLRGLPYVHNHMRRLTPSEKKVELSHDEEPDLHAVSREHPLPELPELSETTAGNTPQRPTIPSPSHPPSQPAPSQQLSLGAQQQGQLRLAPLVPRANNNASLLASVAGHPALLPAVPSAAATLQRMGQNSSVPLINHAAIAAAAAQRRYLEASAALLQAEEEESIARARTLLHLSQRGLAEQPQIVTNISGSVASPRMGARSVAENFSTAAAAANALREVGLAASLSQSTDAATGQLPSGTLGASLSASQAMAPALSRIRGPGSSAHHGNRLMSLGEQLGEDAKQEEEKQGQLDDGQGQGGCYPPRSNPE